MTSTWRGRACSNVLIPTPPPPTFPPPHLPRRAYQLLRPQADEDALGVLTVVPALHQPQEQLGGVVLGGGYRHSLRGPLLPPQYSVTAPPTLPIPHDSGGLLRSVPLVQATHSLHPTLWQAHDPRTAGTDRRPSDKPGIRVLLE